MPYIKSDNYVSTTSRYATPEDEETQERALGDLVYYFSGEMEAKLLQKVREGYLGWDKLIFREVLERKLKEHVERGSGQYIDIANLAAMLWNLEQGKESTRKGEQE